MPHHSANDCNNSHRLAASTCSAHTAAVSMEKLVSRKTKNWTSNPALILPLTGYKEQWNKQAEAWLNLV